MLNSLHINMNHPEKLYSNLMRSYCYVRHLPANVPKMQKGQMLYHTHSLLHINILINTLNKSITLSLCLLNIEKYAFELKV